MDIRRSSRANKGTHTKRHQEELYYQEEGPVPKKAKDDSDQEFQEQGEEEGQVRCDPCGTTQENYDEEQDVGGTMIECERCKTWQHAKCMGYYRQREIPQQYFCGRCRDGNAGRDPTLEGGKKQKHMHNSEERGGEKEAVAVGGNQEQSHDAVAHSSGTSPADELGKLAKKDKTRGNVAQAVLKVVVKTDSGVDNGQQWALKLEEALHAWARTTDKKYIEKSRSVMALLKKPAVLARLVSGDLIASDFTTLPAEEIDPDLKEYADRVRQESIKRSVLTVEDTSSQRIRRTHKGEEIVDTPAQAVDEYMNITARDIDHRKFKEESPMAESAPRSVVPAPGSYQILDDDDDHYESPDEAPKSPDAMAGSSDDGDSEDEMALILNSKKSGEHGPRAPSAQAASAESKSELPGASKPSAPTSKPGAPTSKPSLPPAIPVQFWAGEVVFPDLAAVQAQAQFVSCTNYQQPTSATAVSLHNRAMRVCKDLMDKKSYQIEGRLDRAKADPYLAKVAQSRDFYVVRLEAEPENPSYASIFEYLHTQQKVGVLSGRASFVKDSYVFALADVPEYLSFAGPLDKGLYILFVVKKDYVAVGKSILKKRPSPVSGGPSSVAPAHAATSSLESILSKLEGSAHPSRPSYPPQPSHMTQPPHLPQKPVPPPAGHMDIQQMSANLNADQLGYLSRIMQENPHVQNNPQALLSLLQSMQ